MSNNKPDDLTLKLSSAVGKYLAAEEKLRHTVGGEDLYTIIKEANTTLLNIIGVPPALEQNLRKSATIAYQSLFDSNNIMEGTDKDG